MAKELNKMTKRADDYSRWYNDLVVNAENPRKITDFMQGKLTQSILLSPWMHKLKPICIDEQSVIWSGNQRCASYRSIVSMDEDTIDEMEVEERRDRANMMVDMLMGEEDDDL